MTETTFQLFQVTKDPKSGEKGLIMFDAFDTIQAARNAAQVHLKNYPWAIFKSEIVAMSRKMAEFDA